MELRTLRYFLAVAREGSITAAAETAHITQPSLSRQIAQLESELGTPLFERGRHGARLTPAGTLLLSRAQTLVELADKAEADVRATVGALAGKVRVGCGDLAALSTLSALFGAFREGHPQVSLTLSVVTASQARDRMAAGLDDAGVLLGEIDRERYEGVPLPLPERWVALVRKDDELAQRGKVTPKDLAHRPIIAPPGLTDTSELGRWFGTSWRSLDVAAVSTLNAGGVELVRAGVGVALVIEGMLRVPPPDVAVVPLDPPLETNASLAWPRGVPLTDTAAAFVDFVREEPGTSSKVQSM